MIEIKESTQMTIPLIIMFIILGLLSGVVACFFLINSGKHAAVIYIVVGYGLVLTIYLLLIIAGFYYFISIISKVRDQEHIKDLQRELNKIRSKE